MQMKTAGKAIKGISREKFVLASKWGPMFDDKGNYSHDASADYARKSLQLSLKNLGVDFIDLYILRSKGQSVPIEESVRGMAVSTDSSCSLVHQSLHAHACLVS